MVVNNIAQTFKVGWNFYLYSLIYIRYPIGIVDMLKKYVKYSTKSFIWTKNKVKVKAFTSLIHIPTINKYKIA